MWYNLKQGILNVINYSLLDGSLNSEDLYWVTQDYQKTKRKQQFHL